MSEDTNNKKQQQQKKRPEAETVELTPEEAARALSEQQKVRREKLAKLQAEGRDPFAVVTFDQKQHSAGLKADFSALEKAATVDGVAPASGTIKIENVSVAGRIMPAFLTLLHADLSEREEKAGRQGRAKELMAPRRKRPAGIARRLSRELARRDEWAEGESDSEGLF